MTRGTWAVLGLGAVGFAVTWMALPRAATAPVPISSTPIAAPGMHSIALSGATFTGDALDECVDLVFSVARPRALGHRGA